MEAVRGGVVILSPNGGALSEHYSTLSPILAISSTILLMALVKIH